jgi:hypothetical protein
LDSITKSTLGATIGNITVSAPACADDIALLGESKDIQASHISPVIPLLKLGSILLQSWKVLTIRLMMVRADGKLTSKTIIPPTNPQSVDFERT